MRQHGQPSLNGHLATRGLLGVVMDGNEGGAAVVTLLEEPIGDPPEVAASRSGTRCHRQPRAQATFWVKWGVGVCGWEGQPPSRPRFPHKRKKTPPRQPEPLRREKGAGRAQGRPTAG